VVRHWGGGLSYSDIIQDALEFWEALRVKIGYTLGLSEFDTVVVFYV